MDRENPYATPKANVAVPDDKPGSPVKAVFIGLLIDVGGSLLGGIVLGAVAMALMLASGADEERIQAFFTNPASDPRLLVASALLGTAFSGLGGYACARIAKRSEYKLAFILAVLSVLTGLLFASRGSALWHAIGVLATVAAIMGGTWMGRRKNRASAAAP